MSSDPTNSVDLNRRLPHQDSWITIAPGQTLTLDANSSNEWHHKTRVYREVRGNIVALCFSVEFALDQMMSEIFFPGVDTKESVTYNNAGLRSRRDLFDELFLKGNRTSFAAKTQLLRSMRSKLPWLAEIVNGELLQTLDAIRDFRNRFAHYPVSFYAEQIEGHQVLVAKLVCRDKDIRLDDAFFQDFDARFGSLESELQQIHTAVCKRAVDQTAALEW